MYMYWCFLFLHTTFPAEIKTVICDKNVKVKAVLGRIKETPDLQTIVVVEEPTAEIKELAKTSDIDLISFEELEVRAHNRWSNSMVYMSFFGEGWPGARGIYFVIFYLWEP